MEPALIAELKGRLGTIIGGRWKLVKVLGLGASAAVYRAVDREGWRVAVKVMHSKYLQSKVVRQRFLREQQILDQIRHPHTLRIFETKQPEGSVPFIVMELLEGHTLARIMNKRGEVPLEYERVVDYMLPVLDVLEFCHTKHIIHRDLKPANIFLTNEQVIKLLDFGVARYKQDGARLTQDGTALGTPAFMSPEQASGHMDLIDLRSDIFAVGATMHFLLCGQYLHSAETAQQTYIKAATTPAPSLARRAPHLPVDLIRIVDKAVSWSADERWQSSAQMKQELVNMIETARSRPNVSTVSRGFSAVTSRRQDAPARVEQRARPEGAEHAKAVMRSIDRALLACLQYGADHSMYQGRRREAFGVLRSVLDEHAEVSMSVRPYSFEVVGAREVCWEPGASLDSIPYELFASGVRLLKFNRLLTLEGFELLLDLWMLDSSVDFAPEDDLATLIWDRQILGVELELGGVLGSIDMPDHRQIERAFANKFDAIGESVRSEIALELERRRILESLGDNALLEAEVMLTRDRGAAPTAAEGARPQVSSKDVLLLQSTHKHQHESWVLRLGTTLGEVIAAAYEEGDHARWIEPLGALALRLVQAERAQDVLSMLSVLVPQLGQSGVIDELIRSAISPELMRALFGALGALPGVSSDAYDSRFLYAVTTLVERLGAEYFAVVVEVYGVNTPAARDLEPAVWEFLQRHVAGHEHEVVGALSKVGARGGSKLVELLVRSGAAGLRALEGALQTRDEELALMILEVLAERGRANLEARFEEIGWSASAGVRIRATQALARLGTSRSVAVMVNRLRHEDFHHLPVDERRLNFELLRQLSVNAFEQTSIELLGQQNMLKGQSFIATRALAADMLGRYSSSRAAAQALDAARKRRPWNSRELQESAQRALDEVLARGGSS